jgi:hypothetical protein
VRQPRRRRVGLLVQRVERELGVIGQQLARDRYELPTERIFVGLAQSISDSKYGETRMLIGDRRKPSATSSTKLCGTRPWTAASSLVGLVIAVLGLPGCGRGTWPRRRRL